MTWTWAGPISHDHVCVMQLCYVRVYEKRSETQFLIASRERGILNGKHWFWGNVSRLPKERNAANTVISPSFDPIGSCVFGVAMGKALNLRKSKEFSPRHGLIWVGG